MSLLQQIRARFAKPIVWPDELNQVLIYQVKARRSWLLGTRLQVQPEQVALFVCRGEVTDCFLPGDYRLAADNLPILAALLDWPTGFDGNFQADIFFVSQHPFQGKWGTMKALLLPSSDGDLVSLRAYGTYSIRVIEPGKLLQSWMSLPDGLLADVVNDRLRQWVFDALSGWMQRSELTAQELAAQYSQLGPTIVQAVYADFYAYGLELEQLTIANLSLASPNTN